MGEREIGVVRRCFDAWNRGDLDGVLAEYAPDVEFDGSDIADGVHRGLDDVRAHFEEIFEAFEMTNEGTRYVDAADAVVVLTSIHGRGSRSGATVEGPLGYVFDLRAGRVVRVRLFRDHADALAAAGLPGG